MPELGRQCEHVVAALPLDQAKQLSQGASSKKIAKNDGEVPTLCLEHGI
jgi:hypothetical protein